MINRSLYEITLEPSLGSTFQPTGFPNLGAASFSRPVDDDGWQECLLVESAQSMANRLEATLWPPGAHEPDSVVVGLPYVRVDDADGAFKTSSRLESHRLASPYVRLAVDADGQRFSETINSKLELDGDRQKAPREIAPGIFDLDPLCLVHGVFLSDKVFPGQPKVARAVTSVIEAHDVRQAHSGGVKKDHVQPSAGGGGGTSEGYGMVPFDRTEWVARDIVARVAIDHEQLRAYGLDDDHTRLLTALAQLEVRRLFTGNLRLRTACDLAVNSITPMGNTQDLPVEDELTSQLEKLIQAVGAVEPHRVTHTK